MTIQIVREDDHQKVMFTSGNLAADSRELRQLLLAWSDKPGIAFRFNDGWGSKQFVGQSEVRKLIRRGG